MSQIQSIPNSEPSRIATAVDSRRVFKRYFVVMFLYALWYEAWDFYDDMFNLGIFAGPPIAIPLIGVVIYLLVSLVISAIEQNHRRFFSILIGPVAAVASISCIVLIAGRLGFTSEHFLFLKHRDELLVRAAEPTSDQMLVVGTLRTSGFFTNCTSTTLVVRDPGRQTDLTPTQRDAERRSRLAQIARDSGCGGDPRRVTISHLEGDLYALRID